MSTMPAEGSQSPQELADLADVTTLPITKVKTPDEHASPVDVTSSSHAPHNIARRTEPSLQRRRPSPPPPPPPAPPAGASCENDRCQGTAHFYRDRATPRLSTVTNSNSQSSSQAESHSSRMNGGTLFRSALDSPSPHRGQCSCTQDDWMMPESSSGEGVYPRDEWRVINGYRCPDSLHNGLSPGDDMENYFNANAHMLAYLDIQEGGEEPGVDGGTLRSQHPEEQRKNSSEGSHDTRSLPGYRNGYGSDDGVILNGSESSGRSQEGLSANLVKLSTSSEEQGDFIETDLSLPPPEAESFCDSINSSSDDDLPQLTSLTGNRSFRRHGPTAGEVHLRNTAQRPCEGPELLPPSNAMNTHPSTLCDYKNGSGGEASRPASFGVSNRLCTCSVVSYSRRKPLAPSNQSSSDLDADEGVGGMKASPMEPSPVESEGGTACGITVTSDSSSYFSPEDVDFLDFDMATPSDNMGDFEMGVNIPHAEGGATSLPNKERADGANVGAPNGDVCDDCGKLEHNCLCDSLRACKRLLEGANAQQQATSEQQLMADGSRNRKRLCNVNNRSDPVQQACTYCTESVVGRDSGSGSQEHLDMLSYDDQEEDEAYNNTPLPLPHRTCSCIYSACARHEQTPQAFCEDTNNLDVEVFSAAPSSDYEDELFNVSRQTSTSNFDQDENAYQDAVEDCASNGFHSACSGSDLESEKSNHHVTNHNHQQQQALEERAEYGDLPAPRPPEIPLPIPARSQDPAPRLPPSLPPSSPDDGRVDGGGGGPVNGCPDCGGAEPPPTWLLDTGRLPSSSSAHCVPHWSDYDLPSDRRDPAERRHRTCPAWMQSTGNGSSVSAVSLLDQELGSAQRDITSRHTGFGGNPGLREDRSHGSLLFMSDCREDQTHEESEPVFPDPLPDIFILNLLREKESRALYASQTRPAVEKVMIWNEYEAYVLQVKQIGASACGATAVINVLKAFNIYVDKAVVGEAIKTNTRAEKAPVAEYLLSRSVAGCTAQHLMEGIEEVTGGEIVGRFFCFYPERDVDICHWLGQWMKKGAVAVLTLNLQRAVPQGWDVPDAWHHQMAYGVGPKGVYLTNPLEIVPEAVIREQLTSDSELLVQRQDVISRWTADTDLRALLTHPDARWRQFNVIGQAVNVLREARRPRVLGFRPQLTPHMRIPAWYRPGISLFVRRHSEAFGELMNAPPLPLLETPSPGGAISTDAEQTPAVPASCSASGSDTRHEEEASLALDPMPGPAENGRSRDAGLRDAGLRDSGLRDSGLTDADVTDAGVTDAGVTDAGLTDHGLTDHGLTDDGLRDDGLGHVGQGRAAATRDTGLEDAGVEGDGLGDVGLGDVGLEEGEGVGGRTSPR